MRPGWVIHAFCSRQDLMLENLALRQQVLARQRPVHRLSTPHKLFWVILRRLWSRWKTPLVLVTPRTVVEWHRAGFRLYGKWLSRARQVGGRKPVSPELRALIFRMAAENPTWGAPRIHGELVKLGFPISQPTVSRWLRRAPRSPEVGRRWLAFLRNHREDIAVMDFFTVLTLTFGVLYCFFIIGHDRRKILRFNVTRNPMLSGLVNSCGRRGPTRRPIGSSFWTATRSLATMWSPPSKRWGVNPCVAHFTVPGRTEWPSVGWEAADKTCWIT